MAQITQIMRGLLLGTALIVGSSAYAQDSYDRVSISPEPGTVQHLSEFEVTFVGSWGLGTYRNRPIVVTGPEGVDIPKVYNCSMGSYYLIYFDNEAVLTTPGEYTLTIPEGKFAINDVDLGEMTFHYTIEGAGLNTQLPEYTITPEPGDHESIGVFVLNFDSDAQTSVKHSYVSLRGPEGYIGADITCGYGKIAVTPLNAAGDPETISRPGEYTLTFAPEAITVGESTNASALRFEYTVGGGTPEPWDGTVSFDPADGSTLEAIDEIFVSFRGVKTVEIYEHARPAQFPAIYKNGEYASGCTAIVNSNILHISPVAQITEPGTYTLVIPTEFLYLDNARPAHALEATYIIEGDPDAFEYTYTMTPEPGSLIGPDDAVTITFIADDLMKVENNPYAWGASVPHFTNDMGAFNPNLQIRPDGMSYTFTHQWPFEVDGDYTLVIPADYFTLFDNTYKTVKNATIKVPYRVGTSSVESIAADRPEVEIYTVTGVKVDSDVNSLPAGVYIINGKKAYIK